MIYGFLDPYVFVSPNNSFDNEAWADFVRRITDWDKFTRHRAVKAFIPDSTIDLLGRGGYLPYQSLKDLLHRAGLGDDARDVVQLFSSLLSRLPTVQEELGVADVLLDRLRCNPDVSLRDVQFSLEFERLLAFMCLFRDELGIDPELQKLLTTGLTRGSTKSSISATLQDIEYLDRARKPANLPIPIEGEFGTLDSAQQVWTSIDPIALWQHSDGEPGLEAAIESAAARYAANQKRDSIKWRIGDHFATSITSLGLTSRPIATEILRACTETIFDEKLDDKHEIRKGKSATSPQVTRGSYRAWRRDINHDMHLHYWKSPTEVEFACVTTGHDDLHIPA